MTSDENIRSLAVSLVDLEAGYTMEFAPSPKAHELSYDILEHSIKICLRTMRAEIRSLR